jgi:hypothetical protein
MTQYARNCSSDYTAAGQWGRAEVTQNIPYANATAADTAIGSYFP